MTWITPICLKSKAIVRGIDDVEGLAMTMSDSSRCPLMTGDGTKLERKLEQAVIAVLTARNLEEPAKSIVQTDALLRRHSVGTGGV
jgi:hypothetical protein